MHNILYRLIVWIHKISLKNSRLKNFQNVCHDIHLHSSLKKIDSMLSHLSVIRLEDVILLRRLKFVVLTSKLSLNFDDFYVLS